MECKKIKNINDIDLCKHTLSEGGTIYGLVRFDDKKEKDSIFLTEEEAKFFGLIK